MNEMQNNDVQSFMNYMRMPPELFLEILERVRPHISRQDTKYRHALEPGEKLATVLRHLASGDLYPSLQFSFRVSRHTIATFLPEVCQALIDEYAEEEVQCPITPDDWREVSMEFQTKWNVPHALGALDGKHVAIRCPPKSGSLYYNYKGFFSIVLLALVDADYKFLWCDVGGAGRMSDAQIYNDCELKEAIDDQTIGFPPDDPLPNDDQDTPYFILGDDAFALRTHLMKPYSLRTMTRSQAICNYRISRGRRVVENAFGIMASRFNILLGRMQQSPEVVQKIVQCCVILHNMMRRRYPTDNQARGDQEDGDHNLIPGDWRNHANMHEMEQVNAPNLDTKAGKRQRELLRLYFNSPAGSVPWQERLVPGGN